MVGASGTDKEPPVTFRLPETCRSLFKVTMPLLPMFTVRLPTVLLLLLKRMLPTVPLPLMVILLEEVEEIVPATAEEIVPLIVKS